MGMDGGDAASAGLTTGDQTPVKRRPGRPKGLPRPPGAGRAKGTPNKVTRDIREAASRHGPKALAALVKLLGHPDPKIVSGAAQQVLDRAYGRPMSPTELTGRDGAPLVPTPEVSDQELAHLLLFQLNKAARDKLPRASHSPQTSDGLYRVLNDEPWSPDEPAEIEARDKMYGHRAQPSVDPAVAAREAAAQEREAAHRAQLEAHYARTPEQVAADEALARADRRDEREFERLTSGRTNITQLRPRPR